MLVDWRRAPVCDGLRAGAERRVVSGARSSVVYVETSATATFDGVVHRHEHEQWVVVLEGTLVIRCDEEDVDAVAGDLVYIPPQSWHGAVAVGEAGARYLELSAPPRVDLLPGSLVASPLELRSPVRDGA